MTVLNDCVCQHVGYCDGSCQHPEPLASRLSAAYEKVAAWPENRMTPDAVEELGEGFTDLLKLRNLVPDVLAYLSSTSAGVTEEQTPRVTEAVATAFALGASMGDGKFTSDSSASPTPVSAPVGVSAGIAAIAAERRRQIDAEGWTPDHDDEHAGGEMAVAAACYALSAAGYSRTAIWELWPKSWGVHWFKPSDARRGLVKAGALIAAEIDRLDRSPAVEGK